MPLILTQEAESGESLWGQGQHGLYNVFQVSQGNTVRPRLRKLSNRVFMIKLSKRQKKEVNGIFFSLSLESGVCMYESIFAYVYIDHTDIGQLIIYTYMTTKHTYIDNKISIKFRSPKHKGSVYLVLIPAAFSSAELDLVSRVWTWCKSQTWARQLISLSLNFWINKMRLLIFLSNYSCYCCYYYYFVFLRQSFSG